MGRFAILLSFYHHYYYYYCLELEISFLIIELANDNGLPFNLNVCHIFLQVGKGSLLSVSQKVLRLQ